jgi:hypothetical protein
MARRNESSQPPRGAANFSMKLLVEPAFIVRVEQ